MKKSYYTLIELIITIVILAGAGIMLLGAVGLVIWGIVHFCF